MTVLVFAALLVTAFGVHPDLKNVPEVQAMVDATPTPPDFSAFFEGLPKLGRPLRLASPCVGISGSGHALDCMEAPYVYNNVFDLEGRYHHYLLEHMITSLAVWFHS